MGHYYYYYVSAAKKPKPKHLGTRRVFFNDRPIEPIVPRPRPAGCTATYWLDPKWEAYDLACRAWDWGPAQRMDASFSVHYLLMQEHLASKSVHYALHGCHCTDCYKGPPVTDGEECQCKRCLEV